MSTKARIITIISVGIVVFAGSASLVAIGYERTCYDPLTEMVRREVGSGVKDEFLAKKAAELPFLEKLESAMCARSSMTRAQLEQEHEAVKAPPRQSGDDQLPSPVPNNPVHPVGVIYDERDPSFLILTPPTGKDFVITAELLAEVRGEKFGVYTGYHDSDPLQGEVYVSVPGGGVVGQFYSTPEATGPAKMVAINGFVLTIVTLGGTYDKREPGTGDLLGRVTAPGGGRYEFDLATRTFK